MIYVGIYLGIGIMIAIIFGIIISAEQNYFTLYDLFLCLWMAIFYHFASIIEYSQSFFLWKGKS